MSNDLIGERALSKLRWRCRRGLLENDLFVARFFEQHSETLTTNQANGLSALMDLSDNDLLDLNLGRKTLLDIDATLDTRDVRAVLQMMRHPIDASSSMKREFETR